MSPELIKKIRDSYSLSQEQLGNLLGVSRVMIARYENGQSKVTGATKLKLNQLANALSNKQEEEFIKGFLSLEFGLPMLAALLTFAVACFPAVGLLKLGLMGVFASETGRELVKTLEHSLHEGTKNKDLNEKSEN